MCEGQRALVTHLRIRVEECRMDVEMPAVVEERPELVLHGWILVEREVTEKVVDLQER
jgi:hypothetical protein